MGETTAMAAWIALIDLSAGTDIYDTENPIRADSRGQAKRIAAQRYDQDYLDVRLKRVRALDTAERLTARQWMQYGMSFMPCAGCGESVSLHDDEDAVGVWADDERYHVGCLLPGVRHAKEERGR